MNKLRDSTLGRYHVVSLVARGGMAEVYKAYQPGLDRYVAVKVLHPHLADEPGFIERFEREASSVARLRHPNIVQVIDFDCQEGRYFMVMEFIEGASLKAELAEREESGEPYTPEQAAYVISGVASALDYAHQRDMVHRDIKPGNILFTGEDQVVLTDFGILHIVGSTLYTESAGALGTPAYMSPEQARGGMGDARSDIYSLGVVLYQMLVGRLPFEADAPLGLIQQHLEAPLPPPRQIKPELSEEVEAVILKALAKQPEGRYQYAGELGEALLAAVGLSPQQVLGVPDMRLVEAPGEEPLPLPPCPYRGLFVFREEDAPFFFGREAFTDRLVAAVEEKPLVGLIGPSGSGKSSVVFAGLLPHLRQAAGLRGAEGRAWAIAVCRPGATPIYSLATALVPQIKGDVSETARLVGMQEMATALRKGQSSLQELCADILENNPRFGRLLLVVDQFEELFTLCQGTDERREFMDLLLDGIVADSPLTLVLTIRADFLGQVLSHRPFTDALQDADIKLGPMTRRELSQAIENPAKKLGVRFEASLSERMLDDVGAEPGNLPLLEFALTQLWEQQRFGMLSHQAYEAIRGVEGALARYADQVYAGLEESQRIRSRRVFTQMVTPGEGTEDTRRIARREELGEGDWALVQELADARLVVTDLDVVSGNETVEVVHEVLIQGWGQLQEWMGEDRVFRTWQERLRAAIRAWDASDHDEGALLRGGPLVEAEFWLEERQEELSEMERYFIQEGIALREHRQKVRDRRRRFTIFGLIIGLIIALGLALWANNQRTRAESAEQKALVQASIGLASQALQELEGASPERAVPIVLEALEHYPKTWQAERALGSAILENRLQLILEHEAQINIAQWSPDGNHILTASDDHTAKIWDGRTGVALYSLTGHTDDVRLAEWSPDGSLIATAGQDGHLRVWDTSSGESLFIIVPVEQEHLSYPVPVTALAFSPDGSSIATGSGDGSLKVWRFNVMDGVKVLESAQSLLGHRSKINDIAWSPDGSRILSGDDSGLALIFDAVSGEELLDINNQDSRAMEVLWSINGNRVIINFWVRGSVFATINVGEPGTGRGRIFSLPIDGWFRYYPKTILTPDGTRLVTYGDDEVIIWNAFTAEEHYRRQEALQFEVMDWSPDSSYFVTAAHSGQINVWNGQTGTKVDSFYGHRGGINTLDWSPTGDRILSASTDGTAKVWGVYPTQYTLRGPGGVLCAGWSSTGEMIGAGFSDGTILAWERLTGEVVFNAKDPVLIASGEDVEPCHISWSPDGTSFVIVGQDLFPRLWDVRIDTKMFHLTGHTGIVNGVAWSPDGTRIATTSHDGTLRIWDGYSGWELQKITGEEGEQLISPTWSPDSRYVLTPSYFDNKGMLKIWDADTGETRIEYYPESYQILSATWSPTGEQIASFCDDGIIRVWSASLSEIIMTIPDAKYLTGQPVWSPSGDRLLAGSGDGLVRMWEVNTGKELLSYDIGGQVEVKLAPDGKYLLVIRTMEDTLLVYPMWDSLDELVDHARECCIVRELTPEERDMFGLPNQ